MIFVLRVKSNIVKRQKKETECIERHRSSFQRLNGILDRHANCHPVFFLSSINSKKSIEWNFLHIIRV